MHHRNSTTRSSRRSGFTLVELMVAIGAIAIIAVGIASIFAAIGRTVAGGRRVGQLNQYAALIERQMRSDFEAMTRDGVLMIRHQFADVDGDGTVNLADPTEPDAVALYADDDPGERRYRRIDEILFMSEGEFTSSRTAIVPGLNATSSEAMIYYGHGIRLDPIYDYDGNPVEYELPQVDDGTYHLGGSAAYNPNKPFRAELALGYDDGTNPNRFASDWTLLRRQTLLAPPNGSEQYLPDLDALDDFGFSAPYLEVRDSEIQIGGQPAATSAFRSLAARFPVDYPFPADFIRGSGSNNDGDRYPALVSGVVDVATTDLAEIRRYISDIGEYPWNIGAETDLFNPAGMTGLLDDRVSATLDTGNINNDLLRIQAWMDDLFPTPAYVNNRPYWGRTRYEPNFPDFVGLVGTAYQDNAGQPWTQSYRLADQRALSASVFIPHCTEFIVEYSFGQVYDNTSSPMHGPLIWYGAQRQLERPDGTRRNVTLRYPYEQTDPNYGITSQTYSVQYDRLDGSTGTRALDPRLVYGQPGSGNGADPTVLTARFGYNDPTYRPSDPDVDPPTVEWAWPKLIRVTLTLADPNDPSIEQTFQFVFETPQADSI